MTWVTTPITVEQNSQWVNSFLFFDANTDPTIAQFGNPADTVPHDFTGASLKAQVRMTEDASSTLIDTFGTGTGEIVFISGTIIPGPPAPIYNNGYTWTIAYTRSVLYTAGSFWYDLFQYIAGVPTVIQSGPFTVVRTVTR